MSVTKKILAAVAGIVLSGVAGTTNAATLTGLQVGDNSVQFINREAVFSRTAQGTYQMQPFGLVPQVGDILSGILDVTSIDNGQQFPSSAAPVSEITGFFAQAVASISPVNGTITFRPLTAAERAATLTDGFTSFVAGNYLPGLHDVMALYRDMPALGGPGTSFTINGQLAPTVANATDGPLYLRLGMIPAGSQYDFAIPNVPSQGQVTAYLGLDATVNNTGLGFVKATDPTLPFVPPPGTDAYLQAKIGINSNYTPNGVNQPNGNAVSAWALKSSDPANFTMQVPLPQAAWAGMALLGLMGAMRIRRGS